MFRENFTNNVHAQAQQVLSHSRIVPNQVRSLNIAMNSILKVPDGLFKGLLILNISMNRLKSLNGIKNCPRLLFFNANNNQISSINAIN